MIVVKPCLSKLYAAKLLSIFLLLCVLFLSGWRIPESQQHQRTNTELSVHSIVSSKRTASYKHVQTPGLATKSKDANRLNEFVQSLSCYSTLINTIELSNIVQAHPIDAMGLILVNGLRPRMTLEGNLVAIVSAQIIAA